MPAHLTFAEKHYRISEIAAMWNMGRETVRKLVKDEPDVVKLKKGVKRAHTTYFVPESVASRIHARLLTGS